MKAWAPPERRCTKISRSGLFPGISLTNRDGQKFWLITRSVRTATDTDRKLGTIASSKKQAWPLSGQAFPVFAICLLLVCYLFAICLLLVCYLFATCLLSFCYLFAICLLPLPSAVKRVRHVSDVYIAAPQGFPFRIPFITAC